MPDLKNHAVAAGATVQVGPSAVTKATSWTVSGEVVDSETQETVLASYSFTFPQVLSTLTAAQASALMDIVARFLVTCQTGF